MSASPNVVSLSNKREIKHYEQLQGSEGRKVYYRPERFKARDIFKNGQPETLIDGTPCKLLNLSMNGIAILETGSGEIPHAIHSHVPVQIRLGETVLFEGIGRVVRRESTPMGVKVAIAATDAPINVTRLLDQYQMALFRHQMATASRSTLEKVPAAYRQLCADLLHMLRRYREMLDSFERNARASGTFTPQVETDMLMLAEQKALPEWQQLWKQANNILRMCENDQAQLQILKGYTELILSNELTANPLWKRSYDKPKGYPGDFETMRELYDNEVFGDSLYQKFLTALGLDMARFVRTRMALMRQILAQRIRERNSEQPLRIANVGCGLAREISTMLEGFAGLSNINLTLIDQDEEALSAAYKEIFTTSLQTRNQINTHMLHTSFVNMMRAGELFRHLPRQDVFYSIGVMDYLEPKRAQQFIESMVNQVNPGGMVIVGNMHQVPDSPQWPLECILDWSLIYRTREEMLALAEGLGNVSLSTRVDKTGHVIYLIIEKPKLH